jgi:hypothetical protein
MNPPTDDLVHLHNEHVAYLKEAGPYTMACSCEIFNNEQIEIIKKYGHWFTALVDGTLEPFTQSQRQFVEVIKGEADPVSIEEQAWRLYTMRKEYERKHSERLKRKYSLDEDPFYNRADVGKLRGGMMGTINQTHNQGVQTATFGRHRNK